MSDPAIIAEARKGFWAVQEQLLAASPLAAMAEWVATGKPPSARVLRSAGLDGSEGSGSGALRFARQAFIRRWGFAIPCAELVETVSTLGPVVEVGAGTGYLTALLRNAGLDAIATDVQTGGEIGYGFQPAAHSQLQALAGPEAVMRYPDRAVLCSWPTEGASWPLEMLRSLTRGQTLVLIADAPGGITAETGFYAFLAEDFDVLAEVSIPQFPKVRDRLTIHRRR